MQQQRRAIEDLVAVGQKKWLVAISFAHTAWLVSFDVAGNGHIKIFIYSLDSRISREYKIFETDFLRLLSLYSTEIVHTTRRREL